MPENTVYVGRGTKWGNPFKLIGDMIYIDISHRSSKGNWKVYTMGDITDVVYLYEVLWKNTGFVDKDMQYWSDHFHLLDLSELKGKNLACWCPLDKTCHTDVLIKLVNQL